MSSQPQPLPRRITDLPDDAIGLILYYCADDVNTILQLGRSHRHLRRVLVAQNWACHECGDAPVITPEMMNRQPTTAAAAAAGQRRNGNNNNKKTTTDPFICGVCGNLFCGERIDYDKRCCRKVPCDGCGKVECSKCFQTHLQEEGDDGGYGTDQYCTDCQDEFMGFGMGGC